MSLESIVVLYTLTMLTIAHADRGRPTLKDDERFQWIYNECQVVYVCQKYLYECQTYKTKHEYKLENNAIWKLLFFKKTE